MLGSFGKLNSGLLLGMKSTKSMHIFKPCLECFRLEFLFCCLRRNPLGNIDFGSSLEETLRGVLISTWGIEFRSCPLLYWGIIFYWED